MGNAEKTIPCSVTGAIIVKKVDAYINGNIQKKGILQDMRHCILVNSLKTNDGDVLTELTNGLSGDITPVSWCPHAYMVSCEKGRLTRFDSFSHGLFYLQNASSLVPVCVLDPQQNEHILDLAAAPGGKTIHIAARMNNTGGIVANDVSNTRVLRMKRVFELFGAQNVEITCMSGQKMWERYPEVFDRVLLDAPCSMHGTETPSMDDPKKLAKLQKWLLRSAYSACKPGGVIVYSTCTTTVEENEEVIDWILQKEHGNITLEHITIPHLSVSPALLIGSKHQELHSEIGKAVRIPQTENMEGFFVAKLRKSKHPKKKKHI